MPRAGARSRGAPPFDGQINPEAGDHSSWLRTKIRLALRRASFKPGTVILHSEADDVIPIAESRELVWISGLPESALIVVGNDHRLAGPEPLRAMLEAVGRATGSGRR